MNEWIVCGLYLEESQLNGEFYCGFALQIKRKMVVQLTAQPFLLSEFSC